ncbi:hypothetical protein I3271_01510 [Photobacterium leiognathi]|uniref:hypothetical protein n=1 Tax=Photobacterium leiognathi TaxID=553611 RepID=UPI001EDEFC9A|nr:hypothetical protein [Photobacterium leiognathi]MCG3883356.1 hypothetical protein [Photobacterium leiognathi]
MSKLNKFVSILLLLVFISPFLTTAAFALECEDPNVSSMRAKGREFKAVTATGAGIVDPDQKAEQDQMSEEDKLGLFGKVMNCATLFLQAGISPGNIKKQLVV